MYCRHKSIFAQLTPAYVGSTLKTTGHSFPVGLLDLNTEEISSGKYLNRT
jgi:hypothetical protein